MAIGDRRGFGHPAHNTRTRGNVIIGHNTMQPHLNKADPSSPGMRNADRNRMEKVRSRFFVFDEISGRKDIELIYVTSSNLNFAAYSHSRNVLRIGFKGGREYNYFNVPPKVFEVLKRVGSKGRFHYHSIRNRYAFSRYR